MSDDLWYEDCEWNGDCQDLEFPERCATCLTHHFDGLMQLQEDQAREYND